MNNNLRDKLEKLLGGWHVTKFEGQECYEVENWSPTGEDVLITLWGTTIKELADSAFEEYENFDADVHAAEICLAKHSGDADRERFYRGAPDSLEELLEDARDIKAMYKSVADKLAKEARRKAH